jgi:hypothetical protein
MTYQMRCGGVSKLSLLPPGKFHLKSNRHQMRASSLVADVEFSECDV